MKTFHKNYSHDECDNKEERPRSGLHYDKEEPIALRYWHYLLISEACFLTVALITAIIEVAEVAVPLVNSSHKPRDRTNIREQEKFIHKSDFSRETRHHR